MQWRRTYRRRRAGGEERSRLASAAYRGLLAARALALRRAREVATHRAVVLNNDEYTADANVRSSPLFVQHEFLLSAKTRTARSSVERCASSPSSCSALRQAIQIRLAELRDLWRDHDLTVRLVGVAGVVVLMVLLGRIERRERNDLRDDRIVPHLLARQLLDDRLGLSLLFGASDRARRTGTACRRPRPGGSASSDRES